MMNKPLMIALLLFFIAPPVFAGGPNWTTEVREELASQGKVMAHLISWGRKIYTVATPEQLASCPKWNEQSDPPLSLTDAVELVRSRVSEDNPDFGPLRLYKVRLEQGHEETWLYSIELRGDIKVEDDGKGWATFCADVLMDGTVLERHLYDQAPSRIEEFVPQREPDIIRRAADIPLDEAQLHPMEKQMKEIILPEVDFRQAHWLDIVNFLEQMVQEYGADTETEEGRVKLRIGRYFSWQERRSRFPPHAIEWRSPDIPEIPPLTFAGDDVPVLTALGLVIKLGDLEYAIHGNVVVINDGRKPIR